MITKTVDVDGALISETISTEAQNSIEISMNAKGECAWKVKVYCDTSASMINQLDTYIKIAKEAAETAKQGA